MEAGVDLGCAEGRPHASGHLETRKGPSVGDSVQGTGRPGCWSLPGGSEKHSKSGKRYVFTKHCFWLFGCE